MSLESNSVEQAYTALPPLDDTTKYTKLTGVALFKVGGPVEYDADDNVTRVATEDDLEEIIQVNNKIFEESGDLNPIFLGHRDADLPEADYPPIIGYEKDYRLGKLKDTSAILCDWYIKNECLHYLPDYPRRSLEWVPNKKRLYGTAVLKRQPKINLGLIAAQAEGGKIVLLEEENVMNDIHIEDMDANQIVDMCMKKLYEHPKLKKFFDEADEEKVNMPEPIPTVQNDAGALNTFVPEEIKKYEEELKTTKAEFDATKAELDKLKTLYHTEIRSRKLQGLQEEGYCFNRDEELAYVVTLTEENCNAHLERIKKNYARTIAGAKTVEVRNAPPGDYKNPTIEQVNEAKELVGKEKISFNDALRKVI